LLACVYVIGVRVRGAGCKEMSRRHLANAEATLLDRARTQARMADELMPMQARDGFDVQLLVEATSHSDRYPVSHLHAAL
jgi:hypothetical protein